MVNVVDMKKLGAGRVQLSELPSEFTGKLTREEIRQDRMGRTCIYWVIETENGLVTQKFSPMHIDALADALKALKIEDTKELIGKTMLFRAKHFRIGNPRWIPVEIR